jgi:hypothetical protein
MTADDLSAGIGGTERWDGGHPTVRRNHGDAREGTAGVSSRCALSSAGRSEVGRAEDHRAESFPRWRRCALAINQVSLLKIERTPTCA